MFKAQLSVVIIQFTPWAAVMDGKMHLKKELRNDVCCTRQHKTYIGTYVLWTEKHKKINDEATQARSFQF